MQPRDWIHLVVLSIAAVVLWRYRNDIADAIRRGPWGGGGGPAGTGPAPAADPFTHTGYKKSKPTA